MWSNRNIPKSPDPVSLFTPQVPYGLSMYRNRVAPW